MDDVSDPDPQASIDWGSVPGRVITEACRRHYGQRVQVGGSWPVRPVPGSISGGQVGTFPDPGPIHSWPRPARIVPMSPDPWRRPQLAESRTGTVRQGGAPGECAEPWDFAELRFLARCYRRPMAEAV